MTVFTALCFRVCLSNSSDGQTPEEHVHARCEKDRWLRVCQLQQLDSDVDRSVVGQCKTFVIGEELEQCKKASGMGSCCIVDSNARKRAVCATVARFV